MIVNVKIQIEIRDKVLLKGEGIAIVTVIETVIVIVIEIGIEKEIEIGAASRESWSPQLKAPGVMI